jgi:hypothetical protein
MTSPALVTSLVALLTAAAPDPALLEKLAEHAARPEEQPATVDLVVEELDSAGKAEKTLHEVRRREGEDLKLVSSTVDGKDALEAALAREAKARAKEKPAQGKSVEVSIDSPFQAAQQPLYAFTSEPLDGEGKRLRIGFSPRGKRTEKVAVGEAVVDAASGELLSMTMRPSDYPTFVDEMKIDLTFVEGPHGNRIGGMTIKGSGGFLFIRKRMRMTSTFGY